MKIKSTILENLQNIHLFGKIRDFKFYKYSLGKKEKSLTKELKMNKGLIVFNEERIKFHSTMIEINEDNIKILEIENRKLERNIDNIKKAKEV